MTGARPRFWSRVAAGFRHAFATPSDELSDEDRDVLDRLARFLVSKRLAAPAMLFFESHRPFNFLASQAMTFLQPYVEMVFKGEDTRRLARALEKRESIDWLLEALQRHQAERQSPRRQSTQKHSARDGPAPV